MTACNWHGVRTIEIGASLGSCGNPPTLSKPLSVIVKRWASCLIRDLLVAQVKYQEAQPMSR